MPVFFEDEKLIYDTSGWFGSQKVTEKKIGRSAKPKKVHLEKLGKVFGALSIFKSLPAESSDLYTILAYRYFCLTVLKHPEATDYFMNLSPEEIVLGFSISDPNFVGEN